MQLATPFPSKAIRYVVSFSTVNRPILLEMAMTSVLADVSTAICG